ncbi:hypothetical protein [Flagellimonas onchidii]|uniref:hypothetical protein n=1 Tax=Flagellimonas onchidii TaxID=2562684 RepID=UPI0010A6B334|nr:hypothetical protein [Allomuricauda onchidii]
MKELTTLLFFLLFLNFSFSQDTANDNYSFKPFDVYLDDSSGSFSNIRATPCGKGVIILKIDDQTDIFQFSVIDYKNGWLKINSIWSFVHDYNITDLEGWVHSSIVGIGAIHDFDLLDKPNGKKIARLKGESGDYKIEDVYCEWVKIKTKKGIGWVKSEKLCGNPVTTCP